jgi:hypothetical protein
MFFPPVIERELRSALHRHKGTRSRFRVAIIGVTIVVFFLFISLASQSVGLGRTLHQWFFYWGLYLAIAPPARISIGLFSEERRNQTLELLYLTGMTSGELFIGKLLGGALIASSDLLALAPLLAAPFFAGGISLDLYLATIACLPALLLFCIAVGALASVLFKDDGAAFVFMVLFLACVSLAVPIPYYLGEVLSGTAPFSANWLCLSPAYAPYLVTVNFGASGPLRFWMAMLGILAWSGLCLAFACFFLSRNWRNEVRGAVREGWRGTFDAWVHGPDSWRADLRNNLLPTNPFQWLVQQDRRPVLLCYCTIGLICLLWLIGWRAWPQAWPSNANFFITAMVLIIIVNWLTLFAAARRIGTDRRDGILELLLTTPLSPQEMVDGEVRGLEAQFKPHQIIVLSLLIVMMAGGFMIRSWNARAAITYFLIWCVLCVWCLKNPRGRILQVMWAALNSGRPVYSAFKWRGNKWSWLWMFYNLRILANRGFGGGAAVGFPSGSIPEFTFVCVIGIPACAFYYLGRTIKAESQNDMRRRLIVDMRLIATEPLPDPNDPSMKNWDGTHRLHYRPSSTQIGSGWPVFADPVETGAPQACGYAPPPPEASNAGLTVPQDALALFQLLRERAAGYSMTGRMAMNAHLADRKIQGADLLMSASALKWFPELQIQERTDFLIRGQFRAIRVLIYLTTNPFFEAVRLQFATAIPVGGMEVPAVTVEGLIALNLYAMHFVSRQREYYRNERYEVDIIALLARYPTLSLEPILTLLGSHIPEQCVKELENTLQACGAHAARLHRRASRKKALSPRIS